MADAQAGLEELSARLGTGTPRWPGPSRRGLHRGGQGLVEKATAPGAGAPTYAQVVGAVNRAATSEDYVLTAAGGLQAN